MKKWLGVLFAFLLLELLSPTRSLGQTAASDPTVLNGLIWDKTGTVEHIDFMAGYESGARFGSRVAPSDAPKFVIYDRLTARVPTGTGMNGGSVLRGLDTFYKDSRNAKVCLADAVEIAKLSLGGAILTVDELNVVRAADANDPCSVLNGLSWDKMAGPIPIQHVFLIAGYESGVRFGSRATPNDAPKFVIYDRLTARVPTRTGTNGSIFRELDTFYKDSRNAKVCWADAVEIAKLSLAGAILTEDELNVVRAADANDLCLGESPRTPEAATPALKPKTALYSDSPDGLQRYFHDLRSEFQSQAVPDEGNQGLFVVLPSTLEALRTRVLLPNQAAWFRQIFGDKEGPNLASSYSSLNPDDMLPLFLALDAKVETFQISRLEDEAQKGSNSAPFATPIVNAMKSRNSCYVVYYKWTSPTGEHDTQMPYYFFYVDGEFRPIPVRVLGALSTATDPGLGPPVQMGPISTVQAVYPPLARQGRIQGSVVFDAVIGKDGSVQSLKLVSGHPLLVQAAMDAARQWRYKPALFKGQPVQIATTITINFTLE